MKALFIIVGFIISLPLIIVFHSLLLVLKVLGWMLNLQVVVKTQMDIAMDELMDRIDRENKLKS